MLSAQEKDAIVEYLKTFDPNPINNQ